MTKRDIAYLTIRLLGIYVIINSISFMLMSITNILTANVKIGVILSYTIGYVIQIVFGFIIFYASGEISRYIISDTSNNEIKSKYSLEAIAKISFAVLGLFFIGISIPGLITSIAKYFTIPPQLGETEKIRLLINIIEPLLKLIVGICIFSGTDGINKILIFLRSTGSDKKE